MACPSFSLSLLFVPLGAGLLQLVGFQGNINALADIVQLGNLGAGFFQLGIFRCPLSAEGGILFFPFRNRQGWLCPFRQICMEIYRLFTQNAGLGNVFQKIKKWKSIFSVLQTNPRGFFFSTMIAFFITALYGTSQKIFVFLRRANLFLEA